MNDAFFCNTIWYLLLLATSVTVCWVTMQKSADRKFTLAFGLAVLGFTYWIEVLLLLVLNAYTYYPMLTPEDAFMDAVLGNIFSQVSVSTSALLYCVLDLKSIYICFGVHLFSDRCTVCKTWDIRSPLVPVHLYPVRVSCLLLVH